MVKANRFKFYVIITFLISLLLGFWIEKKLQDINYEHPWLIYLISIMIPFFIVLAIRNYEKKIRSSHEEQIKTTRLLNLYKERAPLPIIVFHPKGGIKEWNHSAEKLFGYTKEEVIGKNIFEKIVPDEVISKINQRLKRVIKGDMDAHGININKTKSGENISCEWYNTPLKNEKGETEYIMAIAIDLSQKIKDQKLIETQKQELETIFNTTLDGIAITDLESNFLYCNESFAKLTGYTKGEIIKTGCMELIPKEEHTDFSGNIKKLLSGEKIDQIEKRFIKKDGTRRLGALALSLMPDRKRILISYRDITQRHELELKLKSVNLNLEKRVEEEVEKNLEKEKIIIHQSKFIAMGEMIAAIAHQWRQPLTRVTGVLVNIEDEFLDNTLTKEHLGGMIDSAEKNLRYMSKTIDDFRNFFRPSQVKERFDIVKSSVEAASLTSSQLGVNYIEFELLIDHIPYNIDLEDIKPLSLEHEYYAYGFSSEFSQVIINIISNAKDAIIEKKNEIKEQNYKGKITLSIYAGEKEIFISIKNNGSSIKEELKERIFEPYFTTKEEGKGTGIGLYMSKMIIEESMGGKLELNGTETFSEFIIGLAKSYENGGIIL